MYVKISSLRRIKQRTTYPQGANSPTIITKYVCLCKWGRIVEENTIGFDDHFVTLTCRRCLKQYHPFIDIIGDEFKFYPKNEQIR